MTGSTSNVLYGNGVFAAISISNVANANYANFAGTVTTNSQPNITSVGTLSSLTVGGTISANNVTLLTSGKFTGNANGLYSIPGANVTGYVGYAGYANVAGQASTVYTAAQPNITSVGNLTTLNVVNYITTGSITAGVVLAGANGNANGYLQGNGYYISSLTGANVTGAVPYAAVANSVAGANVSGQVNYAAVANSVAAANISGVVANANYAAYANQANYAAVATYVAGNNVYGTVANANYAAYSGIAASANSVAGANVTGAVPYATTANSVAVANVVGIGNIATINLTGSTSNVLYGNGAFAAPVVAGANVTGQVNYAAVANSVAVANVVGIGNIATINLNGNASTVLYGNGVFSAVSAANANYANYAGTVTGYDQPNIHTLGNIWGQLYLKGAVGAGSITISLDGVTGSLSATNIAGSNSVNSKSFYTYANTYANRPSAAAGVRTYITDANTTTFHALVGGGGANGIFIYYDGTNWRVG